PLPAALITRFLDYSLPYHHLFGLDSGPGLRRRLVDAGALLLVRLHVEGFFWGDCSLSNVLFRRDAGALMAYLVDAETVERRDVPLPDPYREHELDLAEENIAGGLADLQAAGRLDPAIDPFDVAHELRRRYDDLWAEVTRVDELDIADRHLIEERVRALNDLGFDVEELAIEATEGGTRLRVRPSLVEEGHHARELRRRTGLEVQENQARRLLGDIEAFRAWLEQEEGQPV
ncbi:lipopolysaccharide kinase, partial [cyanobacterium TDX16]